MPAVVVRRARELCRVAGDNPGPLRDKVRALDAGVRRRCRGAQALAPIAHRSRREVLLRPVGAAPWRHFFRACLDAHLWLRGSIAWLRIRQPGYVAQLAAPMSNDEWRRKCSGKQYKTT